MRLKHLAVAAGLAMACGTAVAVAAHPQVDPATVPEGFLTAHTHGQRHLGGLRRRALRSGRADLFIEHVRLDAGRGDRRSTPIRARRSWPCRPARCASTRPTGTSAGARATAPGAGSRRCRAPGAPPRGRRVGRARLRGLPAAAPHRAAPDGDPRAGGVRVAAPLSHRAALSRQGHDGQRTEDRRMRIFIAGATGALGRPAGPDAGRSRARGDRDDAHARRRAAALRGGRRQAAVVVDALDGEAVMAAVAAARPEVVVHQLTAMRRQARPAPHRPRVAAHKPAAHRGHGPPARRGAGGRARGGSCGRASRAGPTRARAGRSRTRATRSTPTRPRSCATTLHAIRHLEGAVLDRRRPRGRRAALRRLLRARHRLRRDRRRRPPPARAGRRRAAAACGRSCTSTTPRRRPQAAIEGTADRAVQRRRRRARRRSPCGCPDLADALGAPPPRRVSRSGWRDSLGGEHGGRVHDPDPRRLERQGPPSWAGGPRTRAGARASAPSTGRARPTRARPASPPDRVCPRAAGRHSIGAGAPIEEET